MNSDSYVFSDSLIAQIPSFLKMIWWNMVCVCVLVAQSCPIPCNPMDCTPPGSSVHGILQARVLEWVAIPFCRGSSRPRNWTWVSCIAGGFSTSWATRGAPNMLSSLLRRSVVSDSLRPHGLQLQRCANEDLPLPGPSGCPQSRTAAARPCQASPSCTEAPRSAPSARPQSRFWTARSGSSSSRSSFHSEADKVESHNMATRSSQTHTVPNFPENMVSPGEKGLPPESSEPQGSSLTKPSARWPGGPYFANIPSFHGFGRFFSS